MKRSARGLETLLSRYLAHVGGRREPVLAIGTLMGKRYVVTAVLGRGAMGDVYRVHDGGTARPFALKTLVATPGDRSADERRTRFLREAALCATVDHPNVVRVTDHGIDEATDVPFLVMPLLEGEDLETVLNRASYLEPSVAVALFVQACEGLAAVHRRGIVHRDVKPSNLFLERVPGSDGVIVKVMDFGLAKAYGGAMGVAGSRGGLTATGRFMGTPQYVSPEQASSAKHVDVRTDVYSLAMSLYHALCGAPAFAYVRSFTALVLEITSREAPPLQDAAPWVSPSVARVVHAAILRDPSVRCPTVSELALALETAVGIDTSRAPIPQSALGGFGSVLPASGVRPAVAQRPAFVAPRAELVSSWDALLRH